jgi:hypothetical protein
MNADRCRAIALRKSDPHRLCPLNPVRAHWTYRANPVLARHKSNRLIANSQAVNVNNSTAKRIYDFSVMILYVKARR